MAAQRDSLSLLQAAPPAEAWQVAAAQAAPAIERLQRPPNILPLYVLKSSQIDAARMDSEILLLLQEQFRKVFSFFSPGRISNYEPELNGALVGLVFALSVWRSGASPGSALLNLRFRDERRVEKNPALLGKSGVEGAGLSLPQKVLYGLGAVVLPYAWARLSRVITQHQDGDDGAGGGDGGFGDTTGWRYPDPFSQQRQAATTATAEGDSPAARQRRRRAQWWRLMQRLERGFRVATYVNFVIFLMQGKYRTPLERLLGARLVYRQACMTRLLNFEYLSQQLVGSELAELATFLLPLVDMTALRRRIHALLPSPQVIRESVVSSLAAAVTGAAAAASSSGAETESSGKSTTPIPGSEVADDVDDVATATGPSVTVTSAGIVASSSSSTSATAGPPRLPAGSRCGICGETLMLRPYAAKPCGHAFCYYCLASSCQSDAVFSCPLDGLRVEAMERMIC